jgi:hypothetical protein
MRVDLFSRSDLACTERGTERTIRDEQGSEREDN